MGFSSSWRLRCADCDAAANKMRIRFGPILTHPPKPRYFTQSTVTQARLSFFPRHLTVPEPLFGIHMSICEPRLLMLIPYVSPRSFSSTASPVVGTVAVPGTNQCRLGKVIRHRLPLLVWGGLPQVHLDVPVRSCQDP